MKVNKKQEANLKSFIFYEPYNQAITLMDDETAGRFVLRICKFMFDDELDKKEMSDGEDFAFTAVEDMMKHSKAMQVEGREQRGYKSKYRHFTFYELYYKAVKMLSTEDSGKFIKSRWSYLVEDKEPCFESTELNYYFSLCKAKLDLSKKRCISKTQNSKSTAISRLTALNDDKGNRFEQTKERLKGSGNKMQINCKMISKLAEKNLKTD